MRKTEELHIDEKKYFIQQYDVPFGLTLGAKLAKILGKPISLFMKSQDSDVGDVIGDAITALFQNMQPEETPKLFEDILRGTHVFDANGKHRQFSLQLDGDDYEHLFKVIKTVFAFQFESLKKVAAAFRGAAPVITPDIEKKAKAIKAM